MCMIYLEPCEVWDEVHRRARKAYRCSSCSDPIAIGEQYLAHFSVFDRQPHVGRLCAACERDRWAFADAHDGTLCQPDSLLSVLEECVGESPESAAVWGPMIERIRMAPSDHP